MEGRQHLEGKGHLVRIMLVILLLSLALAQSTALTARADGIIVPPPPPCDPVCPPRPCPFGWPCPPPPTPMSQLVIRYHRVTVEIDDQVAVTHVDQVFYNPNDWQVEGTYIFPLPPDAAVSAFTLWVDGQPVEGQVLEASQARQKYQEIVNSLRDPALLEYAGRGAVQAHIFPIPPQGERRVELEYTQALPAEGGLVRYVYPLSTEKFSMQPLEQVSVSVNIRASTPIRAIYSPSHPVDVSREGERQARAGYEAQNVLPDADFALYYSMGETQAFHLLNYRDPSEADPDGFFLLLLAPEPRASQEEIAKDLILVLDTSGSMEGEKFQQAQAALRYILQHLNTEDRFNVIAFSTGMELYASRLRGAAEAGEALAWVDRLSSGGSTDINRALLEAAAMADRERPTYLIFLTDGLPTEGVVESEQILANFSGAAPKNLRLFPFGVGYDVDTYLLDSLAQAHHGASTYVLPGERLDEILSEFYARISTPVLTDLALDFDGLAVYDLYPEPLPDLFRGSQIVLVGRYRGGGYADVTLTGLVNGELQTFDFPDQKFTSTGEDQATTASNQQSAMLATIPRLWATRKIGHLLNQTRLQGADQETVDQIVKLSIRYGIVTPYTSYLVTEEMPLGAAAQESIARQQLDAFQATATAPVFGQAAVEKAADQGALSAAQAPAALPGASGAPDVEGMGGEYNARVRVAGSRTYVLSDGVWVDTGFDPQQMQTVKVGFLSDDYFALATSRSELAAAFALGPAVIALSQGVAYQVVTEGSVTAPVSIPPTASGTEGQETPAASGSTPGQTQPATPISQTLKTPEPGAPAPEAPEKTGGLPCLGGLLPGLLLLVVAEHFSRRKGGRG